MGAANGKSVTVQSLSCLVFQFFLFLLLFKDTPNRLHLAPLFCSYFDGNLQCRYFFSALSNNTNKQILEAFPQATLLTLSQFGKGFKESEDNLFSDASCVLFQLLLYFTLQLQYTPLNFTSGSIRPLAIGV